ARRTEAGDLDDAPERAVHDGSAPTGPGSATRQARRRGSRRDTAAAPEADTSAASAASPSPAAADGLRRGRQEHRVALRLEPDLRRRAVGPARPHVTGWHDNAVCPPRREQRVPAHGRTPRSRTRVELL